METGILATMEMFIGKVGAFAWGPPMLILLVGTGNIAGVATAIAAGGPGA